MPPQPPRGTTSRRRFLELSGSAMGASLLGLHWQAALAAGDAAEASLADGSGWNTLSPPLAKALSAIADQIYPPDDTPGATEIGAVHFMDQALGGFMAGAMPLVEATVHELDVLAAGQGAADFTHLPFDQQTATLKTIENGAGFGLLHFLTVMGLFCLPSYGGNREQAGWAALGFKPQHAWQPPFGHYDAEYLAEQQEAVTHGG